MLGPAELNQMACELERSAGSINVYIGQRLLGIARRLRMEASQPLHQQVRPLTSRQAKEIADAVSVRVIDALRSPLNAANPALLEEER